MTLWKVIAKSELRRRTSKFRRHRLRFFLILYGGMLLWAFLFAPMLFDSFMPTLAEMEFMAPYIVPAVGLIIEYMLMIFFLMIMFYPLNFIYRRAEIGHKEMLLAAPLKAGDIFFGEFVGKLPFMLLYVLGLAPGIIGMINPLIDLTILQALGIYLAIFGMCVFALLIGSIISSWIEHKIAKSEKARDLAKALIMLMSVGMVVLIYSLQFAFQYLLEHPEHRNWLSFYPAHWFSNIIIYVLEPSLLDPYILNIWTSLGLVITIPLLVLYLAYKRADSFYSLEGGVEKSSTIIMDESSVYRFFRKILGKKWEGLIIVQFKEFFRKKENISKLIYVFGIIAFFSIVYPMLNLYDMGASYEGNMVFLIMRIFMGGFMLSIIFGGFVFVGSKDLLWVYKKSPRSVSGLIYSYLFMLSILIFIMGILLTILNAIFLEMELIDLLVSFVAFVISGILSMAMTVGVQCFRPAFEEKGKNMGTNMFITVLLQMGLFMGFIFLMIELFQDSTMATEESFQFVLLGIYLGLQTAITIPTFIFGLRQLNRIE